MAQLITKKAQGHIELKGKIRSGFGVLETGAEENQLVAP